MIVVAGNPRCGTSMMMYCLSLCGFPLAFDDYSRDKKARDTFGNPSGFFEGKWNGQDGILKYFPIKGIQKFKNARYILMDRDTQKVMKSWRAIKDKKRGAVSAMSQEKAEENRRDRAAALKDSPHIVINYDTFVKAPEAYREEFGVLFPEIDYDVLIGGVQGEIYVDR